MGILWCYAVVDRYRFERETVAIAMNIVYRFASAPRTSSAGSQGTRPSRDRAEYQLVTITALYIAIKLNERTILGSHEFAAATRDVCSLDDIQGMELKILHALSWRICPPTSLQVANQMLSLMLSQDHTDIEQCTVDLLQEEVAVQTENAVRDHYFATQRPSTVAAAAIMNAIESICDQYCEHFVCEHLTQALVCVIGQFPFESYAVLLGARNRLMHLMTEEEEKEICVVPEEELQHAGAEEESLHPSDSHRMYHLVQDNLDQTPSSPRLVVYDDACDDSSCVTIDPSDNQIIYHLVQDNLDQTPSSPRLVVYDDACDDSSCVTIY